MTNLSRRALLKGSSSVLALPIITRLNFRTTSALDAAVARAVLSRNSSSVFSAQANPLILLLDLLTAGAAIATIADILGKRLHWSTNPNDGEASQCKPGFNAFVDQQRHQGDQLFSDVTRSPIVHDVAFQGSAASTLVPAPNQRRESLAMQYKEHPTTSLHRFEPGVIVAARRAVSTFTDLSATDRVRAMTVTSKEIDPIEGAPRGALSVLYTAVGDRKPGDRNGGFILHDQRPVGTANAGLLWVHIPNVTDPANLPTFGLRLS